MAKLGIDLQEGFENDEVVVTIDGQESFRHTAVRTKRVLGLAMNDTIDVANGKHAIEISVPTRNLHHKLTINLRDELHLGISLRGSELDVITREERFGYG